MTREEAKSCIYTIELLRRLAFNIHGVMDVIDAGNCDKIIAMLSQEPCGDCISRQAAIDRIRSMEEWHTGDAFNVDRVIRHIKDLPSVTPQPKIGHWIFDEILDRHYYCSECKSMGVDYWDFCPNCGAKMVEPQESEDNESELCSRDR